MTSDLIRHNNICAICLDHIDYNTEKILSCNHVFHYTCINEWFSFDKDKGCPLCRTITIDEEPDVVVVLNKINFGFYRNIIIFISFMNILFDFFSIYSYNSIYWISLCMNSIGYLGAYYLYIRFLYIYLFSWFLKFCYLIYFTFNETLINHNNSYIYIIILPEIFNLFLCFLIIRLIIKINIHNTRFLELNRDIV
jgi:hypothetical protein